MLGLLKYHQVFISACIKDCVVMEEEEEKQTSRVGENLKGPPPPLKLTSTELQLPRPFRALGTVYHRLNHVRGLYLLPPCHHIRAKSASRGPGPCHTHSRQEPLSILWGMAKGNPQGNPWLAFPRCSTSTFNVQRRPGLIIIIIKLLFLARPCGDARVNPAVSRIGNFKRVFRSPWTICSPLGRSQHLVTKADLDVQQTSQIDDSLRPHTRTFRVLLFLPKSQWQRDGGRGRLPWTAPGDSWHNFGSARRIPYFGRPQDQYDDELMRVDGQEKPEIVTCADLSFGSQELGLLRDVLECGEGNINPTTSLRGVRAWAGGARGKGGGQAARENSRDTGVSKVGHQEPVDFLPVTWRVVVRRTVLNSCQTLRPESYKKDVNSPFPVFLTPSSHHLGKR